MSGRRFEALPGNRTRPTSERVREAVASALSARGAIEGASVLDLFAGTGALAFEMLSRGAARATLVDHDARAVQAMKRSAKCLGLTQAAVIKLDLLGAPRKVVRALGAHTFELLFADPPYDRMGETEPLLAQLCDDGLLVQGGLAVLEHRTGTPPPLPAGLASVASYRYGDTSILFAQRGTSEP